jgi:transposase
VSLAIDRAAALSKDESTHSLEFKREAAQEFLAGETLHGLAKRYALSRNLIRIWVQRLEAGALDEALNALPDIDARARKGSP